MIDRQVENAIFAGLAATGVAPPYHGRFANGRIEGWLSEAQPLALNQMSDAQLSLKIAAEMAKLHRYQLPLDMCAQNAELSQPAMWTQLFSWLKQAQETCSALENKWGDDVAQRFETLHGNCFSTSGDNSEWNLDRVELELLDLQRHMLPSPAVFAHNDLLAGNIMLGTETGDVKLIDFEYGGTNYRGFDIANHWNEYAGGTQETMNGRCEYERFPSVEQQHAFCRAYLEQESMLVAEQQFAATEEGHTIDKDDVLGFALASLTSIPVVDDAAVQALVEEANAFVLVNHWYWCLWAVNQATMEGVDAFDYLTYAESRAQRYFDTRTT